MGPKRGLEGAQAYRENSQKHDMSKSDSEKFLFKVFYVGRGGSKEPPGGIIYFWTVLSPNGALHARPVKTSLAKSMGGIRELPKNKFTARRAKSDR
jgi:hypothetical protein